MTACILCHNDVDGGVLQCPACQRGEPYDRAVLDCPTTGSVTLEQARAAARQALSDETRTGGKLECDVQAEIVALLELHGWAVYQNTVRGVRPKGVTPGIPDLFAVRERLVWIECKRPAGKVSAAQAQCHARLRAAGQRVIVAYDIEDVADLTREAAA